MEFTHATVKVSRTVIVSSNSYFSLSIEHHSRYNISSNTTTVSSTETINISLWGSAYLYIELYYLNRYDCQDFEVHWEIQRADGETELYTVLNETYFNGRNEELVDKGLYFWGDCCFFQLLIYPMDLRYNGAQITGVVDIPVF